MTTDKSVIMSDEKLRQMWIQYASYPGGVFDFARAVAEAAVKDVKRSTLLEVIQLLNQSPYSLTKRECIDLVTALKMKVDNNEN